MIAPRSLIGTQGRTATLTLFALLLGCTRSAQQISEPVRPPNDTDGTALTPVDDGFPLTPTTQDFPSSITVAKLPPKPHVLKSAVVGFFEALGQGKDAPFLPFFAPSARLVDAHGNETALGSHWTRRLERFDYRRTAHDSPLWEPDIVVVPQDDDRAKSVVALLKPKTQDLLVFVPVYKSEYDGQKLFGRTFWFQLRQDDTSWRIVACVEDLD